MITNRASPLSLYARAPTLFQNATACVSFCSQVVRFRTLPRADAVRKRRHAIFP